MKHTILSLPEEELVKFLIDLPVLLSGWYYGVAMGRQFNVEKAAFKPMAIGTKAYRKLVWWMVWFSQNAPHKDRMMFRLVSIPKTNKTKFKLQPGKNILHSWTTKASVPADLFKIAYKGRHKASDKWSFLVIKTKMPAKRQGLSWKQAMKITKWAVKNSDKLVEKLTKEYPMVNGKNVRILWNDLLKRLESKLIRSQFETICVGKNPLLVEVVDRLQ